MSREVTSRNPERSRRIKNVTVNNMAINPKCDKCKKELKKFGAILLSTPDRESKVGKLHRSQKSY